MVAVQLRIGLGVSLLNGGLIGYLRAEREMGGSAFSLAWTTLLGPAAVAGLLENDLLVPIFQIALGLALVLGFFTQVCTVLAGFLILSGPIFQVIALLSSTSPISGNEQLAVQTLVSAGSMNLLLLVAVVLWLTPATGTPWSLDYLIFAHLRTRPDPQPPPRPQADAAAGPVPGAAPTPKPKPRAEPEPENESRAGTLSATRGE
jgi:hypothetical protein